MSKGVGYLALDTAIYTQALTKPRPRHNEFVTRRSDSERILTEILDVRRKVNGETSSDTNQFVPTIKR